MTNFVPVEFRHHALTRFATWSAGQPLSGMDPTQAAISGFCGAWDMANTEFLDALTDDNPLATDRGKLLRQSILAEHSSNQAQARAREFAAKYDDCVHFIDAMADKLGCDSGDILDAIEALQTKASDLEADYLRRHNDAMNYWEALLPFARLASKWADRLPHDTRFATCIITRPEPGGLDFEGDFTMDDLRRAVRCTSHIPNAPSTDVVDNSLARES